MPNRRAAKLSREQLVRSQRLFIATQELRLSVDPRLRTQREAWAVRIELEESWVPLIMALSSQLFQGWDVEGAINYFVDRTRAATKRRLLKRDSPPPSEEELRQTLAAGLNQAAWESGAVSAYIGATIPVSTASGQFSLDRLGINRTWAWAQPRNMANDMFAVRGSKVIQNMYGTHLDELTALIMRATDPTAPLTVEAVRQHIQDRWPGLQRWQAERIARTETAAVWTQTAMNSYAANGVTQWESIIAHGPSIGIQSANPCGMCVEMAWGSPFPVGQGDLPPWHPSCRCEAVPVLQHEDGKVWLPPKEPFTGGQGTPLSPAPGLGPIPETDIPVPAAHLAALEDELHINIDYELKLAALRKRLGIRREAP